MTEHVFDSAADRIAYSEAVDFLEQGRTNLIPADLAEVYVRKGLWVREDGRLRLTDAGRAQHDMAMRERFTDG